MQSPRYNSQEDFDSWASRVSEYEIWKTQQQIARGGNVDQELETTSKRFTKRLMHPLLHIINHVHEPFDIVKHRQNYADAMNQHAAKKKDDQ